MAAMDKQGTWTSWRVGRGHLGRDDWAATMSRGGAGSAPSPGPDADAWGSGARTYDRWAIKREYATTWRLDGRTRCPLLGALKPQNRWTFIFAHASAVVAENPVATSAPPPYIPRGAPCAGDERGHE